ncbi:MAG: hypothetical protein GY835_17645 [bacterium]|nr:hypothetical protein [bacterium]
MNSRGLTTLLLGLLLSASAAAVEIYPLDDVEPGLTGTAWSVFKGDSIAPFTVEILDRVPGVGGRDLVLVKALGERFERAGVSQGMSGSPVYIDGRLLGAMAFNFSFSRDALAYVTPAGAMLELADRVGQTDGADSGARNVRSLPFLDPGSEAVSATATEINLPLSVAGFDPKGLTDLTDACRGLGLSLHATSGRSSGGESAESTSIAAIKPGAAIAVTLLRGPVTAAAFGTVTHVDGERVWGFGHPFLNSGDCELPLAGAMVHGVMPSLDNSFKISSLTENVGTLLYDAQSGIYGRLDGGPEMLPLQVRLVQESALDSEAEFLVARHEALQPLLMRMAVEGWLSNRLAALVEGRLAARVLIRFADETRSPLTLESRFFGEGVISTASSWLQGMMGVLTANPAGPVPLTSLTVELDWREGGDPLELIDLTIDRMAIRPGEEWTLHARFREGERVFSELITLPPLTGGLARGGGDRVDNLHPGLYQLHMADALSFQFWNATRQPDLYRFDDHAAVLRVLSSLESGGAWIVWLSGPGEQTVLEGSEVTLPVWIRKLQARQIRPANEFAGRIMGGKRIALEPGIVPVGYQSIPVTLLSQPLRTRSTP